MSTIESTANGRNPSPPPKSTARGSEPNGFKENKTGSPTDAKKRKEAAPSKVATSYKSDNSSYQNQQDSKGSSVSKEIKVAKKKITEKITVEEFTMSHKMSSRRDCDTSSEDESYPSWKKGCLPDRSKSDYYCEVCDSHMNSEQMWESHVSGKRHIKNMKKEPGEPASKIKTVKREDCNPMIQRKLDKILYPVVGLSYLCELQRSDPHLDPTYTCYLCHATCTVSTIIDHILGTKHRLAYFKEADPPRYNLIENMHLQKSALDGIAEEHSAELEGTHGRGYMEVKMEKPKNVPLPPLIKEKRRMENDGYQVSKRPAFSNGDSGPSSRVDRWGASSSSSNPTPSSSRSERWPSSTGLSFPSHSGPGPSSRSDQGPPSYGMQRVLGSPPRENRPSSRHPGDFVSNLNAYPMHMKLFIMEELSRAIITSTLEADEILNIVKSLTQSLLEYKIKLLPPHFRDSFTRQVISGDTRDLELALELDNSAMKKFSSNSMDLFPPMGRGDSTMRMNVENSMPVMYPTQVKSSGPMSGMGPNAVVPPMAGPSWAAGSFQRGGSLESVNGPCISYPIDPARFSHQNWHQGAGNIGNRMPFGY